MQLVSTKLASLWGLGMNYAIDSLVDKEKTEYERLLSSASQPCSACDPSSKWAFRRGWFAPAPEWSDSSPLACQTPANLQSSSWARCRSKKLRHPRKRLKVIGAMEPVIEPLVIAGLSESVAVVRPVPDAGLPRYYSTADVLKELRS
jgi:hypothetical protein